MKLLADTHVLLWWLADSPQLTSKARKLLKDPSNLVFISSASVWEIGIKTRLGKLRVDGELLPQIEANGFEKLPIRSEHAWSAGKLPLHHRDPFDRMLVAQAEMEGLKILSHDKIFRLYDVDFLEL